MLACRCGPTVCCCCCCGLFVSNIFASVSVFIDWRGRCCCQVEEAATVCLWRGACVYEIWCCCCCFSLCCCCCCNGAVAAHAACLLPDMTCSRSRKSFCVCHIYELRFGRVLQATSHAMCHLWLPLQQLLLLFNYVQLVCSLSQQMMSLQPECWLTGPTVQR